MKQSRRILLDFLSHIPRRTIAEDHGISAERASRIAHREVYRLVRRRMPPKKWGFALVAQGDEDGTQGIVLYSET